MPNEKGQRIGGRQKGTPNKITKNVRDVLTSALEGHEEILAQKLEELAQEKASVYLNTIAKILPYVTPKMQETDITTGGESIPIQSWLNFNNNGTSNNN